MNQLTETQISRISKFWQKLHKLQEKKTNTKKNMFEYFSYHYDYPYNWIEMQSDYWLNMKFHEWLDALADNQNNKYYRVVKEYDETYQDLIKYIERLGYNMEDRTIDEELYSLFHGEK